jgi:hypothetical protein
MESINRAALIVKPVTPFYDWAKSLPNAPSYAIQPWTSVYLVSCTEEDAPETLIQNNFSEVFEAELCSWDRREDHWPSPRHHSLFVEWFEVDVVDLVLDLSGEPLRHDA